MINKTVLVLGDGLLGRELVKQTEWDYVSRGKDGFNIDNIGEFITDKYDVIINCIGHTDTYTDYKDIHWDVNCKFVDKLIDYCNDNIIKLVHISTDYVYSNSTSSASEEDVPVHNNTWYGYTKLLSDGLVQLRCDDYLVVRCSHKPYPFEYDNAWIDYIGNFDYVDRISNLIIKCVIENLNGVYNVGTEIKTMFELATEESMVDRTLTPPHVPKNLSMDITKLTNSLR